MERNYGMKSLVEALARRRAIESGELWASEIIPGKMFLGCGRDAQNREQLQVGRLACNFTEVEEARMMGG